MKVSFSANRPNSFILSPIPCSAREKISIILFVHMSINISAKPCFCIVLHFSQLPPHSKLPYSPCSCVIVKMSSKNTKVVKNKHGVKIMGLKKDSTATPYIPHSSAMVESHETLNLQPLQHEPPMISKPDFAKKKFKTGTSKRYRSSLMGSASIPA